MSKEINHSYSQTSTFIIAVACTIVFGYLGYWYGSVNPGGFSSMTVEKLSDSLLKRGLARDNPGSVSKNINAGLQTYENNFIGLSLMFPEGWSLTEGWPGDIHDLKISGNTLSRASEIFKDPNSSLSPQFEILYSTALVDDYNIGVKNLDEYVQAYSHEYTRELGKVEEPLFNNPEKVQVGDVQGFKAEKDGAKIYLASGSKGYFTITFRPDQDMTENVQNTIVNSLKFN